MGGASLTNDGPRSAMMLMASATRSGIKDEDLMCLRHSYGDSTTVLWWGPLVPVHDGDLVYYFTLPNGLVMVESVVSP